MTRAWLNYCSICSWSSPCGSRLRLAVELPGNRLLYVAENGECSVFECKEHVTMSSHWISLHEGE